MGENALPIDVEDRDRAIQIVGSTTRRFVNAVGLYLIFALPSLVMGIRFCCLRVRRHSSDGSMTELRVQLANCPIWCCPSLVGKCAQLLY